MRSPDGRRISTKLRGLTTTLGPALQDHPRLQTAFFRLLATLVPPPYRRDNMETTVGPWTGASCAVCTEGRQLGENNATPSYFRERRYETTLSRLRGSREGCPINLPALKSVLKNWSDAIDIIDFVRTKQMERMSLGVGPLSHMNAMILAEICLAIPSFLLRRTDCLVANGSIPASVGGAYKLVAGLTKVIGRMIAEGDVVLLTEGPPSASELYGYTERHGLFFSGDGEVCGGPEQRVVALMDIAIHGKPPGNVANLDQDFFRLIGTGDELVQYGIHCAALKFAFQLFEADLQNEISRYTPVGTGGTDLDRSLFDALAALVPQGGSPSAMEVRLTVLNNAVASLTATDLLFDIERRTKAVEGGDRGSPEAVDWLSPAYRESARSILVRYGSVLECAAEFSFHEQQRINLLLGRKKTASLTVDAVAYRIDSRLAEIGARFPAFRAAGSGQFQSHSKHRLAHKAWPAPS